MNKNMNKSIKPFFYDYVCHMLRFYSAYRSDLTRPYFTTEVDEMNWEACDAVMSKIQPPEHDMLLEIYRSREPLSTTVSALAEKYQMTQSQVWTLVKRTERAIAKKRGLI